MRRRWYFAAALLAMQPFILATDSGALTSWGTFGSGQSVGRAGRFVTVVVDLSSNTKKNPEQLRVIVDGTTKAPVAARWSLRCWNPRTSQPALDNGNLANVLPIRVNLTNEAGGVHRWRLCNVRMFASMLTVGGEGAPGTIRVRMQARYP